MTADNQNVLNSEALDMLDISTLESPKLRALYVEARTELEQRGFDIRDEVKEAAPGNSIALRDYFAGLAMQAIIANPQTSIHLRLLGLAEPSFPGIVAAAAYVNADAMLKARENKS